MAKEKVEQELTVEEKLRALYELQTVNSKIDNLRILAGELPQEVKDMGDEIEGLKTRLTNIENGIKECETGISDHRVRIENANAAISRYKEQQNNVRNNREYDNLTKEIEYQELEIEASQRKINKFKTELEERQADKAKTISDIEDKTVDLNQKRNELDSILAETKEQTPTENLSGLIHSVLQIGILLFLFLFTIDKKCNQNSYYYNADETDNIHPFCNTVSKKYSGRTICTTDNTDGISLRATPQQTKHTDQCKNECY